MWNNQRLGPYIRYSWNYNTLLLEELPVKPLKRRLRVFRLFTDWEVKQGFEGYLITNILTSAGVNEGTSYDEFISRVKRQLQDLMVDYQRIDGPIRQQFIETQVHYQHVAPRDLEKLVVNGHDFTIMSAPYEFEAIQTAPETEDNPTPSATMISQNVGSAFRLFQILKINPTTTNSVYWKDLPNWLIARDVAFDHLFPTTPTVTLFNDKKAGRQGLDLEKVKKLKGDFNMLLKNIPRLTTYPVLVKWTRAMQMWRDYYHDYIYEELVPGISSAPNFPEKWRDHWQKSIKTTAWGLFVNFDPPVSLPDEYWTEERILGKFLRGVKQWESRIRKSAQGIWKLLREFAEWLTERNVGFSHSFREIKNEVIEGFKTRVIGYEPDDQDLVGHMSRVTAGLRLYRQNAAKVYPWLLQNQLPLELDFACRWDSRFAATYNGTHIGVCPWAASAINPRQFAKVMAHEMAHHRFKSLSAAQTKFWRGAVLGDLVSLNLNDVLKSWPIGVRRHAFEKSLIRTNPYLYLQMEALHHTGNRDVRELISREEFVEYLEKGGDPVVSVSGNPITGYAHKNVEEAFCEAVGLLVGFGPRTLNPEAKRWLNVILPEVKMASARRVASRYLQKWGSPQ